MASRAIFVSLRPDKMIIADPGANSLIRLKVSSPLLSGRCKSRKTISGEYSSSSGMVFSSEPVVRMPATGTADRDMYSSSKRRSPGLSSTIRIFKGDCILCVLGKPYNTDPECLDGLHHFHDFCEVYRFCDKAVCMTCIRIENVLFCTGRTEHDDRYLFQTFILFNNAQQFQSVYFRQIDIQQDQVREAICVPQHIEGLLAVPGYPHFIPDPGFPQSLFRQNDVAFIIFNQ